MTIKNKIILFIFLLMQSGDLWGFEIELGSKQLSIHGFASQGFMVSSGNNYYANTKDGTFQFNELGLNLSSTVSDDLSLGMQFFSRDLGNLGNNKILIDWAQIDYKWQDWLGMRLGKVKIKNCLYNYTADVDFLRTSIILPRTVYQDYVRDTFYSLFGAALYGNICSNNLGTVNYQFSAGQISVNKEGAFALMVKRLVNGGNIDKIYPVDTFAWNLEWSPPLEGFKLGFTYGYCNIDTDFSNKNDIKGKLIMENINFRTFSLEYCNSGLDLAFEHYLIASNSSIKVFKKDFLFYEGSENNKEEGYYFSANYRFTNWFQLGAYYAIYNDLNSDIIDICKNEKDLALTMRFDISDYWTFKIEGHYINGAGIIMEFNKLKDLKKESFLLALKATFNF